MPIRSVTELEDAIDAHGADISRWPVELREHATKLLANSSQARDLVELALKMESGLRSGAGTKASPEFIDRVARAAFQRRAPRSRS